MNSLYYASLDEQYASGLEAGGSLYEARGRPHSRASRAPSSSLRSRRSDSLSSGVRPRSPSVLSNGSASGANDSGSESDYQPAPPSRKRTGIKSPMGASLPPRKRPKTAQNTVPCTASAGTRGRLGRKAGMSSPKKTVHPNSQDEEATENTDENGECLLVHSIDWNAPPTWGDDVIPKMPANAILTYLKDTYGLYGTIECLWNGCGQEVNVAMSLKNHLYCDSHINLRRRCPRCNWSVRPDMWKSRYPNHVCGESLPLKS